MVMRYFTLHNQKAVLLQKDEWVHNKRQHLVNDEIHYKENSVQKNYDPLSLYSTSVILCCAVYSRSLLFHILPISGWALLKN